MIWNNEEWVLLSFEEMTKVNNEEILIYSTTEFAENKVCLCSHWNGVDLVYAGTSYGCYLTEDMWHAGAWFLPYRRLRPLDPTRCSCNGPSMNKFCFDTQKVEPVCCRCHKRKRG